MEDVLKPPSSLLLTVEGGDFGVILYFIWGRCVMSYFVFCC